jgi:hypothetical protein
LEYYSVLTPLSKSYPQFKGRLPTRYSPVRHFTLPVAQDFSYDLHVLGTPPAFVLSQDQTLQFTSENDPFQRKKQKKPRNGNPYSVFKEHILSILSE